MSSEIEIVGARTHNLKSVQCSIPRERFTVITGVSGSGKSSLAFDTLYAEGQRRYVESMSTYARQFLERMERPDVDAVVGVPPAIAIEQRNGVRNARSTVGTVTEISDYLRLLMARVGTVHCPTCDRVLVRDTADLAADRVLATAPKQRVQIVALVDVAGRDPAEVLRALIVDGHHRLLLDGAVVDGVSLDTAILGALVRLPVLIDRLSAAPSERTRLTDALRAAFGLGAGRAEVHVERGQVLRLGEGYLCVHCGTSMRPPEPQLFSYNSPLGACAACQGFGRTIGIDWDKVIPDPRKSLADGAIALFQTPANRECQDDLEKFAKKKKRVRLAIPWRELSDAERGWVLDGDPNYEDGGWKKGQWYGVRGFFRYLEKRKYKMHVRVLLSRFRGYDLCAACNGTRLGKEARAVRLDTRSIAELEQLPVGALNEALHAAESTFGPQALATAQPVLVELYSRLGYLDDVGLSYLSLIRQARTLSGGEAQRIALASALGARLTSTLYVLDEPSVGLHPRDAHRLVRVLERLVERGNTVVVVEHDPEVMQRADHVIDLGPGAGARGGEVVFAGSYANLVRDRASSTGRYLRSRTHGEASRHFPEPPSLIRVRGARAHNLKDVDVDFPVGRFTCLTGVSGSGKSSLLVDVLYAQALRQQGKPVDYVGPCAGVDGLAVFDDVVLVDQEPLGRSARSNPATYLKAMDELRKGFASTREAERLGLSAGAFSFNVSREKGGGRCESCAGQGTLTLDMHFLADVTVVCDKCDGRRFDEKVLRVKWHGLTILECLALTVDQALSAFADEARVVARLAPFAEVGLGYLQLGQSTSTLSGGESQRLKLALHLVESQSQKGQRLFLFDEPTTGLHGLDVEVLLAALDRLVMRGHTVIAIEHNLDFMRHAQHVVDLGPEGGEAGGYVVAEGTPEEVARVKNSYTGRALAQLLRGDKLRV